ncbi:DUF4422 domain-containing protein [Acetobacter okinawensis]|uniref:DUF4422 domain-containing protein n=1 Tax=Acetobacter okinawensis TaxID=1076594 RepID=A0A252BTK5_9PROT|nr:DUF4422 domain-containing protein [Acetobacter okinawensis]OUJ12275.1 hypothetical protein HK26_03665 [Acetobacter okinawensis]
MKIELYIAAHKNFEQSFDDTFIPIHVGSKSSSNDFCPIKDCTGENISEKNDTFCELTALYWMWKNTQNQDFIGLLHYRRHLNFSFSRKRSNEWGVIEYPVIDERYILENSLDHHGVLTCIDDNDIILPEKWDVRNAGSTSMLDHYQRGKYQHLDDYLEALNILKEKYPAYHPFSLKVNNSTEGYFTNIFIVNRNFFNQYCSWLFDILFELEKRIDISEYSVQEKRVFGYISEWLLNIFIEKYKHDNKNIKIKEIQRTFVKNPSPICYPKPSFKKNNTPIVISFNNNYAPYAGILIKSIIDNSDINKNYDIFIYDGGISNLNKQYIRDLPQNNTNVNITFLDVDPIFSKYNLYSYSHFSVDTYYRLYIPEVFSNFDRVIYIDSDTLVRKDIADILDIDLNGNSIAAVRDCAMQGFIKNKIRSSQETHSLEADVYLKIYLGIQNNNDYFQAGVLIFDIKKSLEKMKEIRSILTSEKKYWFLDQDILNKVYNGDVLYLDPKWNVYHGNGDTETFFRDLPEDIANVYFASRKNPFVIHFAGPKKPWNFHKIDFASYFWSVARETPWYEELLLNLMSKQNHGNIINNKLMEEIANRNIIGIRDVMRALATPFAPLGSVRRSILRKIFNILRKPFV